MTERECGGRGSGMVCDVPALDLGTSLHWSAQFVKIHGGIYTYDLCRVFCIHTSIKSSGSK